MANINEWTFTADVASQINLILRDRPDLPFSNALVEERGRGSRQRRDLTIYDRERKIVLTGEIKMPDSPEGRSPYQEALVLDAHQKANSIGVEYYFTWNVNKCVLWKTFEQGKSITERYLEPFDALAAPIRQSDELLHPRVAEQISRFLLRFLERCAAIFSGAEPMLLLPLDVKFIDVWEAGLLPLVADSLSAINKAYEEDQRFRNELNKWMRDEQGWTLSNDEAILRDNLERAAKFTCYVLANKIVFYKALRRRFTRMKALKIPGSVKTGEELKENLKQFFVHARNASNDYETVFGGDFGDKLPFMSDRAVSGWRALSEQTDAFDFTQINYEVMGQIFERLLSTTERHKFGQHYTRSEVVDLINAFCIRDPNATVLDPACGGGTFPVRAYQRKSDLANNKLRHQQLINSIFGLDISAYPVHLTTINLATRDLIEEANYPLVARHDFLRTNPGESIFHVPLGSAGKGQQASWLQLPKVDVVVGNPPYVRHEKINEYYGKGYKKLLQAGARLDAPNASLSGRSDILCYFFTHGGVFLEDGGYMGLLTSSSWLDAAYGFALQKHLLDNYEIIAILESNCEPWFTGARVTTAATILRKQKDAAKRRANVTKFVWLKRSLKEFLTYTQTEDDRRLTFEQVRDRIMQLGEAEETDAWRVRVRSQAELYRAGCLSVPLNEADEEEDEAEDEKEDVTESNAGPATAQQLPGVSRAKQERSAGEYVGYKWGVFLRAPEVFFKLLETGGNRLVPLGKIAEIRFGLKSGCDKFFFPFDITVEALQKELSPREFKERYGISRADTEKIRIIRAGDGTIHLIEAKYLEPEIHGLMDVISVGLALPELDRSVVMIPTNFPKNDKYAHKYVEWGETENFHTGATCQGRITNDREWYDLTGRRRGKIIWSKLQQYRHVVPYNAQGLTCNCNLYDVFADDDLNAQQLCAVLNSTVVALMKFLFGSQMGREGNQVTEIFDAKMMLVPDPREASAGVQEKLQKAFDSMQKRKALPLVEVNSIETAWTGELALPDRQDLDDAVLELLGITNAEVRAALRHELYEEITTLYRQIRVAERRMQRHRSETARGGRATAHSIVQEIWENLETPFIYRTPLDFVSAEARTEDFYLPIGRARIVKGHMFQPYGVQIGDTFLELGDPVRCEFVKQLNKLAISGDIQVPVLPSICQIALTEYFAYSEKATDELTRLAAAYTADESMQERIVKELWRRART